MEVKGCTLFRDGVGYFPDAPTERGAKHLRELTAAVKKGYHAIIAFVIQGEGISEVRPNTDTDPEFAKAFNKARKAGVEVVFFKCKVTADSIVIEFLTSKQSLTIYFCGSIIIILPQKYRGDIWLFFMAQT